MEHDPYVDSGLLTAAQRAAQDHGAIFYNAVRDFKTQVASGRTSVASLMRDAYHPTDATPQALGMGRYVSAIISASAKSHRHQSQRQPPRPVARIGGEVVSGRWTWVKYKCGTAPAYDAHGVHFGVGPRGDVIALTSTSVGAKVTYSLKGSIVGFVALADQTSGGQADVHIDGRFAGRIDLLAPGLTMYPKGFYIQGNLPDVEHTVTATVVSGQVRLIAAVAT